MNNFILEAYEDLVKEQTFFSAAKRYRPELSKMMIDFFKKKGVKGFDLEYEGKIKYDELSGMDKKEKKKMFRKLVSSLDVGEKFFSAVDAGSTYNKGLKFPGIIIDDVIIKFSLDTNEEFFESGHDLNVAINKVDGDYTTIKKYEKIGKVNILKNIEDVLKDIWSLIQKAVDKYNSGEEEEKVEKKQNNRSYKESDIQKMVDRWLDRYYKRYKSGKKKIINDYDKKPYNFHVSMSDGNTDKTFDSRGRGARSFTLSFKLKKLGRTTKNSNSYSYRRNVQVNPKIKEKYPHYKEWFEIFNNGIKEVGVDVYRNMITVENTFGEKFLNDDHLEAFERLKYLSKRFLKMGYYPEKSSKSYGRDDKNQITFLYSDDIKKRVENEPEILERFFKSKAFKQNVESTFFNDGKSIENIERKIIQRWFKANK